MWKLATRSSSLLLRQNNVGGRTIQGSRKLVSDRSRLFVQQNNSTTIDSLMISNENRIEQIQNFNIFSKLNNQQRFFSSENKNQNQNNKSSSSNNNSSGNNNSNKSNQTTATSSSTSTTTTTNEIENNTNTVDAIRNAFQKAPKPLNASDRYSLSLAIGSSEILSEQNLRDIILSDILSLRQQNNNTNNLSLNSLDSTTWQNGPDTAVRNTLKQLSNLASLMPTSQAELLRDYIQEVTSAFMEFPIVRGQSFVSANIDPIEIFSGVNRFFEKLEQDMAQQYAQEKSSRVYMTVSQIDYVVKRLREDGFFSATQVKAMVSFCF